MTLNNHPTELSKNRAQTIAKLLSFCAKAGRRSATKLLSKDEARWIAVNIAKLPELLRRA